MTAITTPGQGPHKPQMIEHIQGCNKLTYLTELLNDLANEFVFKKIERQGQEFLNRPEIISPVCLLASLAAWEECKPKEASYFAGYSIGQWSAMTLAEMITPEQALRLSYYRGKLMSNALKDTKTGMSTVIGLSPEVIDSVLEKYNNDRHKLMITNVNAPGQITIGGEEDALIGAEDDLKKKKAFKIIRLPVFGAWHSFVLEPAVQPFRDLLENVTFASPIAPVMNNVTGEYLPSDPNELKQSLADHLVKPVLWLDSIRTICKSGTSLFLEIGYGNMLSKFGLFIDRKAKFENPTGWGLNSESRA